VAVADDPPFLADRPLARAALHWATTLHKGQLRAVDRAPFILHPTEVAALLSGRGCDEEVIAAGLLHDALEKTDADLAGILHRFGERVARIVAAVTEDPSIADYRARKTALRAQVAAADRDAHVVYCADKLVKTRELRAEAARSEALLDEPALRLRLDHYQQSLTMLQSVAPDLAMVDQLAFELWALRTLPPAPRT
jgi:(p)ppGpp synthase/HD superfamily hydrolase